MGIGIKGLVKKVAWELGIDLRRVPTGDAFTIQRDLLASRQVDVIIDVGAFIGGIAKRYHKLFPKATIHCIEPFGPSYDTLRRRVGRFALVHNVGIADSSGRRPFFSNRGPYTNSLLPVDPGTDSYVDAWQTEQLAVVTIDTVTLDDFCQNESIKHVSILKLDIQAGELAALRSATKLLSSRLIDLIYLEVNFAPLYQGQPALRDIQGFLEKFAYRLVALTEPAVTRRGFLAWANAIFAAPDLAPTSEWQWH